MDLGKDRSIVRSFLRRLKSKNRSSGDNSDYYCFGTSLISVLLLTGIGSGHRYLGAGVKVVDTVVAGGTARYELQNEVAGPPSAFKTPKTPVTTLQLTARGAIEYLAAIAEHEAGSSWGAQLISAAAAAEIIEKKAVLTSIIMQRFRDYSWREKQGQTLYIILLSSDQFDQRSAQRRQAENKIDYLRLMVYLAVLKQAIVCGNLLWLSN